MSLKLCLLLGPRAHVDLSSEGAVRRVDVPTSRGLEQPSGEGEQAAKRGGGSLRLQLKALHHLSSSSGCLLPGEAMSVRQSP